MTTTTVTVARPDEAALSRTASSALSMVQAFAVTDAPTFELAAEELQAIKRKASTLDEQRKAITGPLDLAKKQVMDLFKPTLEVLAQAEGILKAKMLAWQQEEQRKANEARLAAEREAQAERERLASAAAALEAEGKAGEAAVQRQVAEMIVAAPVPAAAAVAPKVAGVSTRTAVEFEVTDVLALVRHIAEHPELIALVNPDSVKLRAYVRGLGLSCALPGVRVFEKATLAASRK